MESIRKLIKEIISRIKLKTIFFIHKSNPHLDKLVYDLFNSNKIIDIRYRKYQTEVYFDNNTSISYWNENQYYGWFSHGVIKKDGKKVNNWDEVRISSSTMVFVLEKVYTFINNLVFVPKNRVIMHSDLDAKNTRLTITNDRFHIKHGTKYNREDYADFFNKIYGYVEKENINYSIRGVLFFGKTFKSISSDRIKFVYKNGNLKVTKKG